MLDFLLRYFLFPYKVNLQDEFYKDIKLKNETPLKIALRQNTAKYSIIIESLNSDYDGIGNEKLELKDGLYKNKAIHIRENITHFILIVKGFPNNPPAIYYIYIFKKLIKYILKYNLRKNNNVRLTT